MKKTFLIIAVILTSMITTTFAQTSLVEYKAGHVFYVSLPNYMSKTMGLNDAAIIQFRNSIKDVAGFIIEDNKEELAIADMVFSSIDDFYGNFIKNFLVDLNERKITEPLSKTIGETKFIECDASYVDTDSKMGIYYFVGIAETKDAFYKVLCFGSSENKDIFKADFQKILYSIRD